VAPSPTLEGIQVTPRFTTLQAAFADRPEILGLIDGVLASIGRAVNKGRPQDAAADGTGMETTSASPWWNSFPGGGCSRRAVCPPFLGQVGPPIDRSSQNTSALLQTTHRLSPDGRGNLFIVVPSSAPTSDPPCHLCGYPTSRPRCPECGTEPQDVGPASPLLLRTSIAIALMASPFIACKGLIAGALWLYRKQTASLTPGDVEVNRIADAIFPNAGFAYLVVVPLVVVAGFWWAHRRLWTRGPASIRRAGRWVAATGLVVAAVVWVFGFGEMVISLF
jgi:hypothetical protein